jgi:hypothetical protein
MIDLNATSNPFISHILFPSSASMPPTPPLLNLLIRPRISTTSTSTSLIPLKWHRRRSLRMMTRSNDGIGAAHGRSLLGYTSNTSISSNAIAVAECKAVRAMNSPSPRIVTGHEALLFGE